MAILPDSVSRRSALTGGIMGEHEIPDVETPVRERRAWVRVPSDRYVTYRPMAGADSTSWLGRIRDISQGGIALLLRHTFEPGTGLLVELATNSGEVRCLPARVVRVTLEGVGCWFTGCAFASTLRPNDLQSFLPK
jgi:PilZ domain